MLSYFQSILIGLLQGVTELFPISSLGHSVLVPAWLGWHNITDAQHANESFYLAYLVGLHVATALALIVFFRDDWVAIIGGFFRTLRTRRIETPHERMAWLLVIGTIPVGLIGVLLEHRLRVVFAKPLAAALFLTANGLILLGGERVRRRSAVRESHRDLDQLAYGEGLAIGGFQSLALLAGISRSGVTMVGGLLRGLDHEDSARFAFLLATPVILAAGVYKLHDLVGPNGAGIRGQIVVGSVVAAAASYVSVKFLVGYFTSRNLNPFGVYCLIAGAVSILRFALF